MAPWTELWEQWRPLSPPQQPRLWLFLWYPLDQPSRLPAWTRHRVHDLQIFPVHGVWCRPGHRSLTPLQRHCHHPQGVDCEPAVSGSRGGRSDRRIHPDRPVLQLCAHEGPHSCGAAVRIWKPDPEDDSWGSGLHREVHVPDPHQKWLMVSFNAQTFLEPCYT